MQADSCVSTEIGIFLFFCAATFCHSCMRNMQLVWMSLLNRLTCGQVDQVGLLLRVDDLPSVVVQMALGVVGNFDLRLVPLVHDLVTLVPILAQNFKRFTIIGDQLPFEGLFERKAVRWQIGPKPWTEILRCATFLSILIGYSNFSTNQNT